LKREPNTARAYRRDLIALGEFLDLPIDQADDKELAAIVAHLVNMPRGAAQRTLDEYAATMRIDGRPVNTIRRRIHSTLSLLGLAHKYDVIAWAIKVKLAAAEPVKDTSGPGREVVNAMFDIAGSRDDVKGARDYAIVALLFYQALRAGEALSLRLYDVDLDVEVVKIKAKGRIDRVAILLAPETTEALTTWIENRGDWPGPLFVSMSPPVRTTNPRAPLTASGLYAAIRDLGRRAGAHVHPHGLRHTAASEILRLTNGNIPLAIALTRHTDPKTLMVYDDARRSLGKQAAIILARGQPCYSPWSST
jgi:integrase/recombinase XerC